MSKKLITILCPIYNEQNTVPLFYERLKNILATLKSRYNFELVFTNNRSSDDTLIEIEKIRAKDSSVQVITFSRNFGYQASVLAGISYAAGDAMIVIDVDCEDPPEMIPTFIEKWEQGYDVAYGLRGKRPEFIAVTMMRKIFYRVMKFVADSDIILDMAEFSLFSRRVRNEMIRNDNTFPFLRAEIAYSGFRKIGIKYNRQLRVTGNSNYNLWSMALFAIAGILSVSTFPLRVPFYILPLVVVLNVLAFFMDYFVGTGGAFKGVVLFDIVYGLSLITAQGAYLARIYKNNIRRPVFIVDWDLSQVNRSPDEMEKLRFSS